jgi:Tol biopolymer transport system component
MKKLCMILTLAAVVGAQTAGSPEVLLESARKKELLSGDLEGAIRQYKEILAKHARNRSVAATALVRMGQCYEKLGDAEARKAYERAVREYGDQAAVQTARARLAAMGGGAKPADGMSLRRVDSGARFKYARGVSADGRWIAFSYFDDGGSQGLYDTVSKQEKILVKLDWSGDVYGAGPALSRDGQWLAFATYKNRARDAELRVVRADGAGMRTLHRLTGSSWVAPQDWTPDSRQVLAQMTDRDTTYLCLVNVADGAVKRLKQTSGAGGHAFVSPDGAFIVYAAPVRQHEGADDDQSGDIRIMTIDGSGDRELLPRGPLARPLGWSPDGKGILLWSRKTGDPSLWFVPVANGKASAEPRILRAAMPPNTEPAGIASDGRFFFVEGVQKSNSYLVRLDAGSGAPGQPVRVTSRFEDANGHAAWSPDGKLLAWLGYTRSSALLHLRDLDSGRERTLAFPSARPGITPHYLSDNRTIVYGCGGQPGLWSLCAFDTETSESRPLADGIGFHSITSDGGAIYHTVHPFQAIRVIDPRTKAERPLAATDGVVFHLAVSPDGRSLACVILKAKSRRLVLIDTQTGQLRELGETQARSIPHFRRSISWTPDGASVVLRTNDGVWAYPAAGGERKLLFRADGTVSDVAVSPDGKSLAYTRSISQSDLWALENFLPASAAPPKN